MPQLVSTDSVRPSAYNPREADEDRLDLLELSLKKLGFLLPLYADEDGNLLSGHQRHYLATVRLGVQLLPVEIVARKTLEQRKAINIVFNRGTNDMACNDSPAKLKQAITEINTESLAANLPDLSPSSPGFYRCMSTEQIDPKTLIAANRDRWNQYAFNLAKTLAMQGIRMPIIINQEGEVINGIGRLQLALDKRRSEIAVVKLGLQEWEFARAMLNLLTMDFSLHKKYDDVLRYNSFRRARTATKYLGWGFVFALNVKACHEFNISDRGHRKKWVAVHGKTVLDFGAGRMIETSLLRNAGIDCTPFEPYCLFEGKNEIDFETSVAIAKQFLVNVASKKQWDSIFISSVLNSVPFLQDRKHIIRLTAALASKDTLLFATSNGANDGKYKAQISEHGNSLSKVASDSIKCLLDYEPGITLGEFSSKPKVQKYHTLTEWRELFEAGWYQVKVDTTSSKVNAICRHPRPVSHKLLAESIRFEFDLPYPNEQRMSLTEEALDAFSARLGVDLKQAELT